VHLFTGCRQWTVTRLYPHLPWEVRDDRGNLLETFEKIGSCEEFILSQDRPVVHYPA
jgi:hypothetical protein